MEKNKYELLGSSEITNENVFQIVRDRVRLPTGKIVERSIVKHPGAVVILPKTNDDLFLVCYQYRHAVGESLLEFPAGTLEVGEEPLNCAKRELQEEVQHAASSWQDLGCLYPSPGLCSELQYLYFATNLTPSAIAGDEDEIIEVRKMSLSQVEAAIASGQMKDGKSLAIFLRAKLKGFI